MPISSSSPSSNPSSGPIASSAAQEPPATSLSGEWAAYRRFMARPHLPERAAPLGGGTVLATMRLFALDITLMTVILLVAVGAVALGITLPETALATMEWDATILLFVLIGAPIGEELAFRGWLSGKPGHVAALLALGIGLLSAGWAYAVHGAIGLAIAILLTAIAAIASLAVLRAYAAPRWYRTFFAAFFALSSLAFGAIHLSNYQPDAGWIVIALVVPQLVAGTIFGFARVQYGLWSAIALHMLHNATALTLAALTTGIGT